MGGHFEKHWPSSGYGLFLKNRIPVFPGGLLAIDSKKATRIAEACKSMHFFEPQKKSEYSGSKTLHTMELVNEGRNIATTHQAFRYYPHDLLDLIKEQHYTIIIDENVDVLETFEIDPYDVQMAIDAKYVEEYEPNLFRLTKDTYNGQAFKDPPFSM